MLPLRALMWQAVIISCMFGYFPLYGHENGVLGRDGHTEALLDLTRMAGLTPGGALIEILNQDRTMARLPQLLEIAEKFSS